MEAPGKLQLTGPEPLGSVNDDNNVIYINTCLNASGLFVYGMIDGTSTFMLVDTGATVSLLSQGYFSLRQPFQAAHVFLHTADDKRMIVHGKISCDVSIGFVKVQQTFYVVDMDTPVLLGLDFLTANNCKIDVMQRILELQGQQIPLQVSTDFQPGLCRVVLAADQLVASGMEVFCAATLSSAETSVGIVEPDESLPQMSIGLAASISQPKEGLIGIRLINLSTSDVQLYKGMHLGKFSQIAAIGSTLSISKPAEKEIQHMTAKYQNTYKIFSSEVFQS